MRLPGESSQQEQLLHHVQEHTEISPLLQSYHLPCAPCCALLGRHTNVLTMQAPGARNWAAPYCHQLSLAKVPPHSHADSALCLNKQVGKYTMSTILTYLIPQEFSAVGGEGAVLIKKNMAIKAIANV